MQHDKWALNNKIKAISLGYTDDNGKPVEYIQLTSASDSIRVSVSDFNLHFELGYRVDGTLCRLKNDALNRAKILAQNEQIELAERKEFKRLAKKFDIDV